MFNTETRCDEFIKIYNALKDKRKEVSFLQEKLKLASIWLANAYIGYLPDISNGMSPPDPSQICEALDDALHKKRIERTLQEFLKHGGLVPKQGIFFSIHKKEDDKESESVATCKCGRCEQANCNQSQSSRKRKKFRGRYINNSRTKRQNCSH